MELTTVEKLSLNFKTLEEFRRFKKYGLQELSMFEDLQADMIENRIDSPFYGIYYGDTLIARMCLNPVLAKYDSVFGSAQDALEISKLEVLKDYQGRGYGRMLVNFAKSFGMPIRTIPRVNSTDFWNKMGFDFVTYNGTDYCVWEPQESQYNSVTVQ